MKSFKIAHKKVERDINHIIDFVDYNESAQLNVTQVGQVCYLTGVFKYCFNEDYEEMLQNLEANKKSSKPLTSLQIKTEDRRNREEEFLV